MSAIKPNTVQLKVGEQAKLPEICCQCDSVTRRTVTIRRSMAAPAAERPPDGSEPLSRALLRQTGGLGLFAWLFTAILDDSGNGKIKVTVRLPQCRECARRQRVEPQFVDWDYCQMFFIVTTRFAEQFVELNPGAKFRPPEVMPIP